MTQFNLYLKEKNHSALQLTQYNVTYFLQKTAVGAGGVGSEERVGTCQELHVRDEAHQ